MIRNLKKLLAFTIVFAMLLSTVAFASPYPDVPDDAKYAEAVITLSSLGLLKGDDQGNFNPDNTITRAEFAAVIVRTLGLGDPGPTATNFVDVPATHWGSGYVQMASQMGVIAGYGDGNFGLEDPVTFEQAIKMIVAALGYTPKANALGGYPTGYMVVAAQEGISAGINATAGEPALRKVVAELVYNALDVPLMVQTGWGTDITYEQQDGQGNRPYATILTQKLDVDKVEGIVTDNNAVKNVGRRPADKTVTITYDKVNGFATSYYYNTKICTKWQYYLQCRASLKTFEAVGRVQLTDRYLIRRSSIWFMTVLVFLRTFIETEGTATGVPGVLSNEGK